MRAYEFDQDEEATWLRALFEVPPAKRDLTQILHPQVIERQFDFHLRHGIWEYPYNAIQFGRLFGDLLEDVARESISKSDQSTYWHLSKKARLIEAWGHIITSSLSELAATRDAIRSIVESPDDDLYPLARHLIITTETMMYGENVCDPDELESMIKRSRLIDPYATSLLYQELAIQYLYSPAYTMKHIQETVRQGLRYCAKYPDIQTQMIRLEELYALGVFMKANDPRKGAERIRSVIAQLRMPEHNNPILLIESLGCGAKMILHAGLPSQQAVDMLRQAHQQAESIGSRHLAEWIMATATTFGISLQIEELNADLGRVGTVSI